MQHAMQHMPSLHDVPLVGTAVPLVFPKGGRVAQPPVGSWVKLRNLGARAVDGQLQVGDWWQWTMNGRTPGRNTAS